jgi:hypothetical protein
MCQCIAIGIVHPVIRLVAHATQNHFGFVVVFDLVELSSNHGNLEETIPSQREYWSLC